LSPLKHRIFDTPEALAACQTDRDRVDRAIVGGLALAPRLRLIMLPLSPVVYIPTPPDVVTAMLDLAAVGESDLLYDLGCGDGRIAIAAARRGARAVGVDVDADWIARSRQTAIGVPGVEFRQQDIFACDFSRATVVVMYLLPQHNLRLRPALERLRPGSRIVSLDFDLGDWEWDRAIACDDGAGGVSTLYRWTVGRSRR